MSDTHNGFANTKEAFAFALRNPLVKYRKKYGEHADFFKAFYIHTCAHHLHTVGTTPELAVKLKVLAYECIAQMQVSRAPTFTPALRKHMINTGVGIMEALATVTPQQAYEVLQTALELRLAP